MMTFAVFYVVINLTTVGVRAMDSVGLLSIMPVIITSKSCYILIMPVITAGKSCYADCVFFFAAF